MCGVVESGNRTSEVGSVVPKAGLFTLPRWDGRSQMLAFIVLTLHTECFSLTTPNLSGGNVPLYICMQGKAQLSFLARLGHLIRQASLTVHGKIIKQCMSDTCDREFPQIQRWAATVELMEYWANLAVTTIITAVNDNVIRFNTNKLKGKT